MTVETITGTLYGETDLILGFNYLIAFTNVTMN